MNNIIYTISNFSFAYPFSSHKISIVGDIVINQGDVILITGHSGSGKSSLLYALKGLFPNIIKGQLYGELEFNGVPVQNFVNNEHLKIGLVFQNPNHQIINRLVKDELAFGLENLGLPRDSIIDRINQYVTKYDMNHLLERNIATLSGGEKQRIILLSILLTNPDVLLLDEPTAFLDPDSANLFMGLIDSIKQNKTIIIIEHNLNYVLPIANRVFNIDRDGVVNEVSIKQVLEDNKRFVTTNNNVDNVINKKSSSILSINNLTFAYSREHILFNNFNLTLDKGDCLGIKGVSGSGKSTLLKIIIGLEKTCTGEIIIQGTNLRNLSKFNLYAQMGLLLQNPEHHFLYESVEQEVNYNQEILDFFDLSKLKQQNPFTLSEGQKRRLSLAILCVEKKRAIYLLDEPSFGQDYVNKLKLIELIKQMQHNGASFIIVSHDIEFLNSLCNKMVTLNG